MTKVSYSSDVKWAVVKEKLTGELTNREIMDKYGIKNNSPIKTWMKWYRNNEMYRSRSTCWQAIHIWIWSRK